MTTLEALLAVVAGMEVAMEVAMMVTQGVMVDTIMDPMMQLVEEEQDVGELEQVVLGDSGLEWPLEV